MSTEIDLGCTMATMRCGCLAGAFVNTNPVRRENKSLLSQWIGKGFIISTVNAETVRSSKVWCDKHDPKKPA